MDSLRLIHRSLTGGVADRLARLADSMPGLAPRRADPTADDPSSVESLRRFVREIVTADPMLHENSGNLPNLLMEYALECVEWEALARHPQLRQVDWSQARLSRP